MWHYYPSIIICPYLSLLSLYLSLSNSGFVIGSFVGWLIGWYCQQDYTKTAEQISHETWREDNNKWQ